MSQTDDSSLAESIPTERARRNGWQSLGVGALTLLLLGFPGVLAGSEIAVELWGTDCSGHSDTAVWWLGGSSRGWCELGNMDQAALGAAVGLGVALVLAIAAGLRWRSGRRHLAE